MKPLLLIAVFSVSFGVGYSSLKFIDNNIPRSEVLSIQTKEKQTLENSPTATNAPIPTVAPTDIPTPSSIPTSTPTRSPTTIPQPEHTSEEINGFIDRFAGQYGVDPHVLRHIAICESGFNPHVTKLSYVGLYQFTDFTWKKYRLLIGENSDPILRANAEEAVQTAAYVLSIGDAHIWPNCVP